MGPIQYFFLLIFSVVAIIGIARGYNQELGNSVIFMFMISALGVVQVQFGAQLNNLVQAVVGVFGASADIVKSLIFNGLFLLVVIVSYTGVTFIYGVNPVKGFIGTLLTLIVGLFNGWLVAGTFWYYSNLFSYPLMGVQGPLSTSAQTFVDSLLPQTIFGGSSANPPVFMYYWLIPPTILLVIRVIR